MASTCATVAPTFAARVAAILRVPWAEPGTPVLLQALRKTLPNDSLLGAVRARHKCTWRVNLQDGRSVPAQEHGHVAGLCLQCRVVPGSCDAGAGLLQVRC